MRGRQGIRLKRIKVVQRPGGRRDVYYRHQDGRFIPLPDAPENSPEFIAAYHAAANGEAPARQAAEGTLAHAATSYRQSAGWKSLAPNTRTYRLRVLGKIIAKGGHVPLHEIRPRHIANDLAGLDPHAARNRLKVWRALMKFCRARGLIETDPARDVQAAVPRSDGHHTWTDDEIEAFRAGWPTGTPQRMAMELGLWSAARRDDAVRLGRQNLRGDVLTYTQGKTGATVTIPVMPAFAAELAHLPAGQMLFLQTAYGHARSAAAFGAWFRAACDAAGLPRRCTFHGLRKARARIMAENGASAGQIAAWTGHRTLAEVQHYSAQADRARMARDAAKLERDSTPFQKSRKGE